MLTAYAACGSIYGLARPPLQSSINHFKLGHYRPADCLPEWEGRYTRSRPANRTSRSRSPPVPRMNRQGLQW